MAKALVTQELVSEVAQALIQEDAEPSIIAIQKRIGGGSYGSVKKYLDVWKQQRQETENAVVDLPDGFVLKANQFVTTIWNVASREAKSRAQTEINKMKEESNHIHTELAEARGEITRLEGIESELNERISDLEKKVRLLEIGEAQAQAHVSRLENSEQELKECRSKLEAAQETIANQSLKIGELTGEAKALRNQLSNSKTADA